MCYAPLRDQWSVVSDQIAINDQLLVDD